MKPFDYSHIIKGIASDLERYTDSDNPILSLDTLYLYLLNAGFVREATLDMIPLLIKQIYENDRVLVEDDIDRVCDYIEEKRNTDQAPEKPIPSPNRIVEEGFVIGKARPTNTQQGECDQRCEHELMIGCSCGGYHWLQAFYFVDEWMTEFMVNFIDRPWSFWNRIKMGTKFILGLSNDIYFSEVNIHSRDLRKLRMFIDSYLVERDRFAKQLRKKRRNK